VTLHDRVILGLIVLFDAVMALILWPPVAPVNDYVGFVAGGKALLAGQDPYDAATWTAFATGIGQRPDTAVFGYPPWVAVALVPLALLPTLVGSAVWTVAGMAASYAGTMALAARYAWPRGPVAALTLASWPAILVLLQGQWGFALVALACALLLALARGQDLRAGVAWAALALAKPQLVALGSFALLIWLVRRRRPRPILAAAVTAVAAVAVGTLAAPGWLSPYLSLVLPLRSARSVQQPSLAGLAGDIGGALWPLVWLALAGGLAVLIAWAVARAPSRDRAPLAFTAGLALSIAASPYIWSYDHYLAVPLGAATIGITAALPPRRRIAATVTVLVLFGPLALGLFESAYLRWHDTLAGLVPPLAIALAALIVWRVPRDRLAM